MKVIMVTLTLSVKDEATIEDVLNDIDVNFSGDDIDTMISVDAFIEDEVDNERND